jgi:hypothetical protein
MAAADFNFYLSVVMLEDAASSGDKEGQRDKEGQERLVSSQTKMAF